MTATHPRRDPEAYRAPPPAGTVGRIEVAIARFFALIALLAFVSALLVAPIARPTLLVNGAVLLGMLGCYTLLDRLTPRRPLRLMGTFVLLQMVQPAIVVIAVLTNVSTYWTDLGEFSHHTGATRVAGAFMLFTVATTFAGIVVGFRARRTSITDWPTALAALPDYSLRVFQNLALAAAVIRVLLIFRAVERLPAVGYGLRVFVSVGQCLPFFVGVGLRLGQNRARLLTALILPAAAILLISGNRGDALTPLLFIGTGFLVTRPMSAPNLRLILLGAVVAGSAMMFVGSAMRSDLRGRSGQAALDRLGNVAERLSESAADETNQDVSPVPRLLRNATHAVITLTPEYYPWDAAGIEGIPSQLAAGLLPRLNLTGRGESESARNFMLNDLGFMVNEVTSVELAVVPDAWWRGGFLAVLLVGLIAGVLVQSLELLIYRGLERVPEKQILVLLSCMTLLLVEGRDIVTGVRAVVLNTALSFGILFLVRMATAPARRAAAEAQAVAAVAANANRSA